MKKMRSWLFWPVLVVMTIAILIPLLANCIIALLIHSVSQVNLGFPRSTRLFLVTDRLIKVTTRFSSYVTYAWGRSVLWSAGTTISEIQGLEFTKGGPYVVVMNHTSILDIPACLTILRKLDFRFGSDPKYLKIPIFGWDMKLAGYFEIDRKNPRKGLRTLLARGEESLMQGISIVIFPEGTRSRTGELGELSKGPFKVAIEHGVPVLVVTVNGLREAIPPGKMQPTPTTMSVRIDPPIETDKMDRKDMGELVQTARDMMVNATTQFEKAR